MTNKPSTIRDKVLARINAGNVHMRPKAFFVAQVTLLLVLSVIILAISIFLANFFAFTLRVSGHGTLLSFGSRGVMTFLRVMPWGWLAADVLLIAFTTYLLRRFRWSYTRPALIIAAGLFIAALASGFFIDTATPFNDDLLHRADQDRLPGPIHDLYEHAHEGAPHGLGIYRGIVSTVGTSTLTITHDDFDHDEDDGALTIIPPPHTDITAFSPGDRIYVAGSLVRNSTVEAYGIQKLHSAPVGD